MDFRVFVRYGMQGPRIRQQNLRVFDYHVDTVGGYAGSYDI